MKKANGLIKMLVIFVLVSLLFSCKQDNLFSKEELRFFRPYIKNDSIVFKSAKGQFDTIIFYGAIRDTVEFRNIEQGFYNDNTLSVGYKLTANSYHRIIIKSIHNEPERFISFNKAENSHSNREISFLGLLFDDDYVKNIIKSKNDEIIFSRDYAKLKGVNINESINSFKFSFSVGVVSFIDKKNIEWLRIN